MNSHITIGRDIGDGVIGWSSWMLPIDPKDIVNIRFFDEDKNRYDFYDANAQEEPSEPEVPWYEQ